MSKGFTLAEVLITLGVIGIIAALTLPSLISKYRERQVVSQVKVAYSIFDQAFRRAIGENGPIESWGLSDLTATSDVGVDDEGNNYRIINYVNDANIQTSKILFEAISPYLKLVKSCKDGEENKCVIPGDNFEKSSQIAYAQKMNYYSGILSNGMSFYIFGRSGGCKMVVGTSEPLKNICATLTVDINGKDRGGIGSIQDSFRFWITKFGVFPVGSAENSSGAYAFGDNCVKNGRGESCAAWVLFNENMDYLHCKGLSWEGKHKCGE